jgi:hypothetical protein
MKIRALFFIKLPQKAIRIVKYICEYLFFRYFYSTPKISDRSVPEMNMLFGGVAEKNIEITYQNIFPSGFIEKTEKADIICKHIFDLLGSGSRKLSRDGEGYQNIDWHSDCKSGFQWNPKTFYRNIRYGVNEGEDIKVPWELSRFQHLLLLGQAYMLSKDEKYREEFSRQIEDWIYHNPVGFGVNWACTMDVAIRSVNWLVAMEFFYGQECHLRKFMERFYFSVYEHGRFIRSHLENTSEWTTNHYLANIAGLFFISIYCPFFPESRDWKEFALYELHREIEKQVYPDGCSYESSTSYHRLALEMFFYPLVLGQRAGIEFREGYREKVKRMFEFSLHCVKPNGMIPQIGDNDNSRFLTFTDRSVLEHRYLLSLASVFFGDARFKQGYSNLDEEVFWVFGSSAERLWNGLVQSEESGNSASFPDAGWYILRHENDYCFISCGSNGGDGWHAHNDKLGFELAIGGKDILVDPGTYTYTANPEERNKFRSTEYHNVIKFDEYEQNDFSEIGIFALSERVKIIKTALAERDDAVSFEGKIAYLDVTHERTVTLYKNTGNCQITDSISCASATRATLIFHLAPSLMFSDGIIMSRETGDGVAALYVKGYSLKKGVYEYSQEYGSKVKAEKLEVDIIMGKQTETVETYIRKL